MSYEDIAMVLRGKKVVESEIDHLIYVSRMITYDYTYNKTLEPGEKKRVVVFMPYVKQVKGVKMIFNAMISEEYRCEAAEKLGLVPRKLDRSDYIDDYCFQIDLMNNLKGVDNQPIDRRYLNEVMLIAYKISNVFDDFERDGKRKSMLERDIMNKVMSDNDSKVYQAKFKDAMYVWIRASEYKYKTNYAEWKMDNGYLGGLQPRR